MRRTVQWLLTLLLCALPFALGHASGLPAESRRALLIGCDYFVSQEDTYPAAENNVRLLADTLMSDDRGYALIRTSASSIGSLDAFRDLVLKTFGDAQETDVSLLYISTHGVFDEGTSNTSAALILSDGEKEVALDALTLQEILDQIPGTKMVILDACNSGAFIGKGLSGGADRVLFGGADYKVLCSAGGSEASWYWQGTDKDAVASGASYFAAVLCDALGGQGDFAADVNHDGEITLAEAYQYIYDNYAASTPQVYPQNDSSFVLYQYDVTQEDLPTKAITDITFEDTLLTAGQSDVTFAFTVQRQVELYYQVVYHQNGAWQFAQAQHFQDAEQTDGTVLPGRKERTLVLDTGDQDAFGYAMIQFITVENGSPMLQGARLLCVAPEEGPIELSVVTDPVFAPASGEELCILAQYNKPCGLTVSILDEQGHLVRYICYSIPTRPQQLSPMASAFYWDGRKTDGTLANPGKYVVHVRTTIAGQTYSCLSQPFDLTEKEP